MPHLTNLDTRAPKELDKKQIKEETENLLRQLTDLQNLFYAEGKHSLLILFQGMDASGKDGAIKNVLGKINPQGIAVTSFKTPTGEEAAHDFLWRIHQHAPKKGMMRVFNRSHYEDVLITRVHNWCSDSLALQRFKAINDFEQLLARLNNTVILKCYLHISPEEQQQRLQERIDDPTKQWKYNKNDLEEAKYWERYMQMYEDVFVKCNAIPWNFIPADQNWYKEYLVARLLVEALQNLNMQYPSLNAQH